jgi:hypothetical protein
MDYTFSLCHTTARLPIGWVAALEAWLKNCDDPRRVQYVLSIDAGETMGPTGTDHIDRLINCFGGFVAAWNTGKHSAVDGWNAAALASSGRFLITVADDYRPCEHWDTELLKALPVNSIDEPDLDGEYVLDVDNQDNSFPLLPFSFLTRPYYRRLGNLFYPGFLGVMADNDFTDVARGDGVVISARHLKFTHLHPDRGLAPNDDVYRWQQRPEAWEVGNRVYNRRRAEREQQRAAV